MGVFPNENATVQDVRDTHQQGKYSRLPLICNTAAAPIFAKLRASGIKPADAMHLATAAHGEVDLFLTNDKRLHKLAIPGLPFIATLETDLF